ncbi:MULTISPECIES: trypsin-like peptidase domain-containing protein [unclassified Anabaena]|uniref:trypsin-like peptidase domain-containing protein n=1 Tax=unclassified Anabaena TaxID=2619674 RepID=UPI0039C70F72
MESTELEELLTNIQKLQSVMIGVATNQQEYRIQDYEEEYKELYGEIVSQIEDFQSEGLSIENPNNFHSLWDWSKHWKANLSTLAWRGAYIHNLYQNIYHQINVIVCKNYIKLTSLEMLDHEIEPSPIEELKVKIKTIQSMMIEVASEGNAISLIQYYEENYNQIYRKIYFKIEILKARGISVCNPNQFWSLWQWYSFYSEQLENVISVRQEYIDNLYVNVLKPIERALKQHRKKTSSIQEFTQDLQRRFNQPNAIQPINCTEISTNFRKTVETFSQSIDTCLQEQGSKQILNTFSVAPTQSEDNVLLEIVNNTSIWRDENIMNPEIFLDDQDVIPLIKAVNSFALKFNGASDRQDVLENSGIDTAFLSSLKCDEQPNKFAQALVSRFKTYQISKNQFNYHPLVNLLKHLSNLTPIYGFSDPEVELFMRLVEKGQENFKALAARNAVARIESPIGNAIGTGLLIKNNFLLTCNHIFTKSQITKVWVRLGYKASNYESEKDVLEVEIIKINSRFDYALLKINTPTQHKAISINEISILDSGQEIRIIHHPQGNPVVISGLGQIMQVGDDYIDHNVKTDHGSSGAPILNRQWELIAIHQGNPGIGRAVTPGSTGGIPIRAIWNEISTYLG